MSRNPVQEVLDLAKKIEDAEKRRAAAAAEKSELMGKLEALITKPKADPATESQPAATPPPISAHVSAVGRTRKMPAILTMPDEPAPHTDADAFP